MLCYVLASGKIPDGQVEEFPPNSKMCVWSCVFGLQSNWIGALVSPELVTVSRD